MSKASQSCGSVATRQGMQANCIFFLFSGDDIDGAIEGLAAEGAGGGSVVDFDALDIVHSDKEICREVSSLRVGDGNSVQENGHLVKSSSAYANIRLYAEGTTLSHVYAGAEFQQVVDSLYMRLLDVLASQDLDFGGRFPSCHRHSGSAYHHFVQLLLLDAQVLTGIVHAVRARRYGRIVGDAQHGYRKGTDAYLPVQTGKCSIPLVGKPMKGKLLFL